MAQIANTNFLSPLGFRLVIARLPEVEYFLQRVSLPGINIGASTRETPFVKVPYPSDKVDFNDFGMTFKVNEDLESYLSIWRWMIALGFPENFDQYKKIATDRTFPSNAEEGMVTSDITLDILDNKHTPKFQAVFRSCWPASLSDLSFQSTDPTVTYLTADVIFKYTDYVITKI